MTESSPSNDHVIYLDHAAATPVDQRVIEAMTPYFTEKFYNPSSVYLASKASKADLDEHRAKVAHWLGAKPSEIVFTAGATEANNIAIRGVAKNHPNSSIIISSIEHDAVVEPAKVFSEVKVAKVNQKGSLDIESLKNQISDDVSLISIILANNEIGVVQKMSEIAALISRVRLDRKQRGVSLPIYLHSDASQAGNYLDLHTNKLGVDLMTLNAGKMYGPKQSGALYIRAGVILESVMSGGGQEKGVRSGTESLANAAGFAKSLDIAQKTRKEEHVRLHQIRTAAVKKLSNLREDVVIHGHAKHTLPNIISFMVPNLDGERAVMHLDELGVQCATGSACSANKNESSHVIQALGYSSDEAASTIRLSMGRTTTLEDMERAIEAIDQVLSLEHVWRS